MNENERAMDERDDVARLVRLAGKRHAPSLRHGYTGKPAGFPPPRINVWSCQLRFEPPVERRLVEVHHLCGVVETPYAGRRV